MTRDEDKVERTFRRFRKSLDRILRTNAPKEVHDLRTRSRRLEAAIHALELEDEPAAHRLLKTTTRLRRRAGKVRDLDVLTGFTRQLAVPGQEEALAALAEHLSAQRKKAARRLKSTVSNHREAARRALKRCRKQLLAHLDVQEKIEFAAATLQAALSISPRIGAADLHRYRIKLKELRYTLELSANSDAELVSTLEEATGAIGEWHDWSELQSITTELFQERQEFDLLNAIRSTASAKLHNALTLAGELHKRYFSRATAH
ncbi:hypothetical protein GCM10011507_19490 [Edaphobacter acidisoli]|uniref:CHAD domain-containing protein n=1 Tax=Edaphobacter acidisoli TaxID=2040573 RepID=A0A916W5E8_9BACT|nr:CHAD domain-containing protein [Edaphobacter acidisoli]GGA68080.1 hypothetical protein GCM10011507_19490 [Edaphobacter acidisoli]